MAVTYLTQQMKTCGAHKNILKFQLRDALVYWVWLPAAVILTGKGADTMLRLEPLGLGRIAAAGSFALLIAGSAAVLKSMKDLSGYGNGTANPARPPKLLVRNGLYSLCRHPMFFGYDLAALGVVLLFHSKGMLFISYPAFIFLEVRFLKKEERILERRFRNEFREYRKQVSFLIPFLV